jgi:regulatory protein
VRTPDLAAAKQRAYRLLSMRPHSQKEIEAKLRDKGFPAPIIKEALEKLRDLKYLNDASFALQRARHLAVNKLWGNRRITADLREKGIPDRLIDDAVLSARHELSEEEAAAILIRKKSARGKTIVTDAREKQRIFQSLMGRGFPPGVILNKLGKAAEEEFDG